VPYTTNFNNYHNIAYLIGQWCAAPRRGRCVPRRARAR
jgi:hypothetical protein